MDTKQLIAAVENEIACLQEVRALLSGGGGGVPSPFAAKGGKKRVLSAEARAKIAAAQKRRWAKQKKAAK